MTHPTPPPTEAQRALRRDAREQLQRGFVEQLRRRGVPEPQTEVRFAPPRRYRFDLCWPALMLAVEVQGGVWRRAGVGAHTGGAAQRRDAEKANLAASMGYRVMYATTDMVRDESAADVIAAAVFALLPFLTDGTATFDYPRAVKAFAAAAITAFAVRMGETLFDASRAANGMVNRSDVGAFLPPLRPPSGPPPPGSPPRLVSNVPVYPPPGAEYDREQRPRSPHFPQS